MGKLKAGEKICSEEGCSELAEWVVRIRAVGLKPNGKGMSAFLATIPTSRSCKEHVSDIEDVRAALEKGEFFKNVIGRFEDQGLIAPEAKDIQVFYSEFGA